jgi:2-dehydro-3-deoxy-D-arabinonate dehydratase
MQLCRFTVGDDPTPRVGLMDASAICELGADGSVLSIDQLLSLSAAQLREALTDTDLKNQPVHLRGDCTLLKPIESQEVWACGVTYERSRDARMRESSQATVYDLVYDAPRPEVFFKATPGRVVGPGAEIAIRADSGWDVPEPELALVLNSALEIVGYTIGNDVSSRAIEGENPLYLPQAKTYNACCALGPGIALAWDVTDPLNLTVRLTITRDGATVFSGDVSTARLHRTFADLVDYLGRDNSFSHGAILLTGTGIIPADDFTLQPGDLVQIAIDGLGLAPLENTVRRGTK